MDRETRHQHRSYPAPAVGTRQIGTPAETATVLVVEDDPILVSTLSYNLGREGYDVLAAADGESGLLLAREHAARIDLIVLDIMLPGMSGFHVLRHIRADSSVPVLLLSARGEEQDKVDGLELGADDYIVKPFAQRELLARIRAAVRRRALPSARPPAMLTRGSLAIEPDRRRAAVGDHELQLRPKEFGLLLTLALEPERVFSRHDLLDTVWGSDVIVDERTVDVHVSWLRGKLQEAGLAEDMIRTVYGSGYRFVVPKGADHLGAPGDEHPSPFEHSPPRLRGGTATG